MKRVIRFFLKLLMLVVALAFVFFFWASSPTMDEKEYSKLITHDYETKIDNDSIYSIVTYNIGYLSGMTNNRAIAKPKELFETNLNKVVSEIKKESPDIIAFQEIDYNAARSYEVDQEEEISESNLTLNDLNRINRENYYKRYFPKPEKNITQTVLSTKKGICWYRGYFKDDLSQEEVEKGIEKFNAKAVVVGHTIQSKVKKYYNGKVLAIDVKHPNDYLKSWPNKKSEGLLIEKNNFFRILHDGTKQKI